MEIIEINGYTIEEKIEIAKRHLLPKQIKEHGLKKKDILLSKEVIEKIVDGYTRESGVRGLDKKLAKVVRYAKICKLEEEYDVNISVDTLHEILGPTMFSRDKTTDNNVSGVVTGLAWTSVGGDILFIESTLSKGKGQLSITGNLGKVMKESATIAIEYLKSNSLEYGIPNDVFDKWNTHIHVPEGAYSKKMVHLWNYNVYLFSFFFYWKKSKK